MTPRAHLDLNGIRVLDGGMATELEKLGCDLSGPLWSARVLREHPERIEAVHERYIDAGADVILTASYQVSAETYAAIGFTSVEADRASATSLRHAVMLAEQARARHPEKTILIAASLGPYGAALHNGSEYHGNYQISFDDLIAFHRRRIAIMATTSADVLAFETVPSLDEARAIVAALQSHPDIAAWVSFTCRDGSHTAHGEPIIDCGNLLDPIPQIVAIGANCNAPSFIGPLIQALGTATNKPIIVYPNSGEEWDAKARTWKGETNFASFAELAHQWRQAGAQIVGGCCRTGPEHIRSIRSSSL